MFWINLVKSIVSILQSEISPTQVAWGFALGSLMGFIPFSALHSYLVFVLILMLNVNIGAATLATLLFSFLSMFTDPLADKIGYLLLVKVSALTPLWTKLYNMPIVPFTKFNNTVVLGSFVISLILFIPCLIFSKRFIVFYRANYKDKVAQWKIMKLFKFTSVAKVYDKFN
jgi:uncharacterized protein (TIGR03546 family)